MARTDYSIVTETPGLGATAEQLSAIYTRYHFAARFVDGKDVLEVACGVGNGLGYLAKTARHVVGGDIEESNLKVARSTYAESKRVEIHQLDAERLPFKDASFDVVILFEAIYYLRHPRKFLAEARRVLRPGGRLLISTVHPQWNGFNPSPYSVHYPTAGELYDLVHAEGFTTHLYAAFPAKPIGPLGRLVSWVRKVAVVGRLIPRTMRGKEFLKRLFYGQLNPVPRIVHDGMAPSADMVALSSDANAREYKFLYVLAEAPRRRAA